MTQQRQPISAPTASPMPAPTASMTPSIPAPQAMPQAAIPPMPATPSLGQPAPMPMPGQVPVAPAPVPAAGIPAAMPAPTVMPQVPNMTSAMVSPIGAVEPEAPREGGEKALPAISIHAFCDRNETAGVINDATRDWRMKRTNVKIFMGGLSAAVEFYRKESTPKLIMIETGMREGELFAQLEQLASVCDEGTKVIVIGATNDIKLYRQLMDQGVSDYLVPPFHPLGLIRSVSELYSDPEKPFVGRTVSFFGAKGGVGSSTLAHNIAWCLAEQLGQETALVDLDASWGTTGLDFAYDASQGLEEALAEPDRLDETLLDRIMIRHTKKLSILPTAGALHKPVMMSEAYEAVVNGVRGISPLSILDLPHLWVDWTSKVITSSDDVVITATPNLANLRNTKNIVDFLKAERPNDADPILILNKIGMSKANDIEIKDFAATVGLDPAVTFAFDPDSFTEASNDGKMMTEIKAGAGHVTGFNHLAHRLKTGSFPVPISGRGSKKGLLSKSDKGLGSLDAGESKSLFSKLKKRK